MQTPRIEHVEKLLIAGLGERYRGDAPPAIPAQWKRLAPSIGTLAVQAGKATFGVICARGEENGFDYVCGVEVSRFDGVPATWARVEIEEQRYAVFAHRDHVSSIRSTMAAISAKWLPASGYSRNEKAPEFERYGESFDARSGLGGFEIWVPIAS